MSKFRRSWILFKRSMQVIGENKKLLLFPVITFVLTCVIALFFITPIVLWDMENVFITDFANMAHRFARVGNPQQLYLSPACYILFGIIYIVSMFLATFFNVAFFNEILNALNGHPVSISGGLRLASSRLKAIFAWSLFAGIVGLIIKALEERLGWFGSLIMKIVGIAWSVASVFVVPVIIREEKYANPVRFVKTSAAILKRTWGESLIGYLGISFGGLFLFVSTVVLVGPIIFLFITMVNTNTLNINIPLMLSIGVPIVIMGWIVFVIVFSYFLHVASQVYLGALYIYATEGVVPEPFDQEQMNMAWRIKSGRKTNEK